MSEEAPGHQWWWIHLNWMELLLVYKPTIRSRHGAHNEIVVNLHTPHGKSIKKDCREARCNILEIDNTFRIPTRNADWCKWVEASHPKFCENGFWSTGRLPGFRRWHSRNINHGDVKVLEHASSSNSAGKCFRLQAGKRFDSNSRYHPHHLGCLHQCKTSAETTRDDYSDSLVACRATTASSWWTHLANTPNAYRGRSDQSQTSINKRFRSLFESKSEC